MKNLKMIRISVLVGYEFEECNDLCKWLNSYVSQCENEEGANFTKILKSAKIKIYKFDIHLARLRRYMNAYKDLNGGLLPDDIKCNYADFMEECTKYYRFFID